MPICPSGSICSNDHVGNSPALLSMLCHTTLIEWLSSFMKHDLPSVLVAGPDTASSLAVAGDTPHNAAVLSA